MDVPLHTSMLQIQFLADRTLPVVMAGMLGADEVHHLV
jgi:hypothetical protein